MKFTFSILIFLFLFSSCKKEKEFQLTDEKLIDILVDLHIAEASMVSLNQLKRDTAAQIYYEKIFQIHGVNDSLFFEDFELLRKNTDKIDFIYNKVFEEIEQLGAKKIETKEPEKKK